MGHYFLDTQYFILVLVGGRPSHLVVGQQQYEIENRKSKTGFILSYIEPRKLDVGHDSYFLLLQIQAYNSIKAFKYAATWLYSSWKIACFSKFWSRLLCTMFKISKIYNVHPIPLLIYTVCPRSNCPFYIVRYYIKWVTTSWTHSTSKYV